MKAIVLAMAVQTCTTMTTTTTIRRTDACEAQADAWCMVTDPSHPSSGSGCRIIYRHWCGMGGEVTSDAQEACLDALYHLTPDPLTGFDVPLECRMTWATWM